MAHQEPTLLELADKYAKEYFMGRGDAARTRLQTAIINSEVANHTELERLATERDAALARLAELEKQEPIGEVSHCSTYTLTAFRHKKNFAPSPPVGSKVYAAAGASPQPTPADADYQDTCESVGREDHSQE